MNRVEIFSFRVSDDERRAIAELANHLQRSQSDAVRFVVVKAARELSGQQMLQSSTEKESQRGANEHPNT